MTGRRLRERDADRCGRARRALDDGRGGRRRAEQRERREQREIARAESERLATFYFDEFRKNGMTVSAPPPQALKDGFKKIGAELAADWEKRAGADGAALLKAFRAGS